MTNEFVLDGVKKAYGSLVVLDGIDLEAQKDRILAILGPSGCGKTTLLSIMAGLITPDGGCVHGPDDHAFSFLFQDPRLLDWLTVAGNIEFVLKDRLDPQRIGPAVDACLDRVGLLEHRSAYPRRLSGGQRQRVAMARAMAFPARALFMDEPFKSLDPGLRFELMDAFLGLWAKDPRTVVMVTHDVKEALLMADEVLIMSSKPSTIMARYAVDTPRPRDPANFALLRLEQEITGQLLGAASVSGKGIGGTADPSGRAGEYA